MAKGATIGKLRDDFEEEKETTNIENNQIFSNIAYSNPKKKSQKTFEFFKSLKSCNSVQTTSLKGQLGDPQKFSEKVAQT